jgi:hypothetical protein
MRALLLLLLIARLQPPLAILITVSSATMDVGGTVTYEVTLTQPVNAAIALPEEMIIADITSDCVVMPANQARCVLGAAGTITVTAQLERAPCGPLIMNVLVRGDQYLDGPPVRSATQECMSSLPVILR